MGRTNREWRPGTSGWSGAFGICEIAGDLSQQIDQALDRSLGGLGIGLTLARRLARLHGGDLSGHSAGLGLGSEFVLRLPLAEKSLPASDRLALGPAAAPSRGLRRRILIVEDNLATAHSLSEIIGMWGHECRVVHSGTAAMREAMDYFPDLVLLDIGLPVMDGFAVAPALRQLPGLARVEIIAMSGYGQTQNLIRAEAAGIDRYLVKPIDLAVLQGLLEGHSAATPTRAEDQNAKRRDGFLNPAVRRNSWLFPEVRVCLLSNRSIRPTV